MGISFQERTSHGWTGWMSKQSHNKMQPPAQLEDMSETEIPPEVVDLLGGPTRTRTWNQQLERQAPKINGFSDFLTFPVGISGQE